MKIDGRKIAEKILEELKLKIQKLNAIPHLAIILIGNDPASKTYVKQKILTAEKIGIKTSLFQYPSSVSMKDLFEHLNDLNHLNTVHGIIVQQPLPPHLNLENIMHAIDPRKDVDGFHPNSKFQSPIALAVFKILGVIRATPRMVARQRPRLLRGGFKKWLNSQKIVVIGKGETGGKPIINMLKQMGIEPVVIDSKTKNPEQLTKKADIIISAVGKPNAIKPEMIKKGVILIGVGLHKGNDGKLHGDYEEEKIKNIASFYTPIPGGVGPVNVAMLLENLVTAAENFYLSKSTEA
ncbi:MAG: bifunctional 5,10-methylenetetrahydrofolate dehydrogenase/5,10-methenyltetrahydrofolate cyclohydrolase [Patescibacteria group bacterium]